MTVHLTKLGLNRGTWHDMKVMEREQQAQSAKQTIVIVRLQDKSATYEVSFTTALLHAQVLGMSANTSAVMAHCQPTCMSRPRAHGRSSQSVGQVDSCAGLLAVL